MKRLLKHVFEFQFLNSKTIYMINRYSKIIWVIINRDAACYDKLLKEENMNIWKNRS